MAHIKIINIIHENKSVSNLVLKKIENKLLLVLFILLFSFHINYLTNKFMKKKIYSYRLVTIYAYFFNSCGVW
jgi:hypothetical protein